MADRYDTILLFGPPGVGKGTQGQILARIPGFFHSSTGDIFRNLDASSDIGKLFFEYSSRGELVPDDVTLRIWHQTIYATSILGLFKPNADLLVLDGLPRSVNQAKLLYKYVNVRKVIHLMCPDKEALFERMRRRALKQNRPDDAKVEVIRRRFEVYEQQTYPVLAYYDTSLRTEVDAMGSPAAVLNQILTALVPIQNEHFHETVTGGS